MNYKDLYPDEESNLSNDTDFKNIINSSVMESNGIIDSNEDLIPNLTSILHFDPSSEDPDYISIIMQNINYLSQFIEENKTNHKEIIFLISKVSQDMSISISFIQILHDMMDCSSPALICSILNLFEKIMLKFPVEYFFDSINEDFIFDLIQAIQNPNNLIHGDISEITKKNIGFQEEEASLARTAAIHMLTCYLNTKLSQANNDENLKNNMIFYSIRSLIACDDGFNNETELDVKVQMLKMIIYIFSNLNYLGLDFNSIPYSENSDGEALKDELFSLYYHLGKLSLESKDEDIIDYSIEALSYISRFKVFHTLITDEFFLQLFDSFMASQNVRLQKNILELVSSIAESHSEKAFILFVSAVNQHPDLIQMFASNPEPEQRMGLYKMARKVFENVFASDFTPPASVLEAGQILLMHMYEKETIFFFCQMSIEEEMFKVKSEAASAAMMTSSLLSDDLLLTLISDHMLIEIIDEFSGSDNEIGKYVVISISSIMNLLNKMTLEEGGQLFQHLAETSIFENIEQMATENADTQLMEQAGNLMEKILAQQEKFPQIQAHPAST